MGWAAGPTTSSLVKLTAAQIPCDIFTRGTRLSQDTQENGSDRENQNVGLTFSDVLENSTSSGHRLFVERKKAASF